jgi:uncharacterized membrane protein YccC
MDRIGGMDAVWIAIGIAILLLTLLDAFLAVLNYNEAGIVVNRIVRWEWVAIRSFTRRVSRRWRPLVLRQVTGVLTVTTLLCWILGLVLGFTLIYLGLIGFGLFQISKGVAPDFVGAFYLSVGQFSTSGADNIAPGGGWVDLLPVTEALLSVVMISFFVTFLSNIYSVIQNLRSLCADFFRAGPGVGNPVEALQPFFPDGHPRGLDLHLTFLVNDFNLYCDSLRQDRAAYHFQSGEDQFSLPYALSMTSGIVGALQWGLPQGHVATQSPELVRIIEAFGEFRDTRYRVMGWRVPLPLTPLTADEFEDEWSAYRSHRIDAALDPWAARFFALNESMAKLAAGNISAESDDDPYRRYVEWLAFAHPAQHFVSRVGRDLDFQPIYRDDPPIADQVEADETRNTIPARARRGLGAWLQRRQIFLDPGLVRSRGAMRSLVVVAVSVALAMATATLSSFGVTTAGALAGLIAMFASTPSGLRKPAMRRAGLIGLVPVAVGVACGALLPPSSVWTTIGLAVIAAFAVWLGRFGAVAASSGRLFFIASFFSAVLVVEPSTYVAAFVAAGLGVVVSWAAGFLPDRAPRAQLNGLVHAFRARATMLLDAAIDMLSAGSDRTVQRRMSEDSLALESTSSRLAALLDPDAPPTGLTPLRTRTLRLRVFDIELASQGLVRALPSPSDYAVSVDVRSRLAGELVSLQRHLLALGAEKSDAGESGMTENGASKSSTATSGTAKIDTAKIDTAKIDTAKIESAKADTAKIESANADTTTVDGAARRTFAVRTEPHADWTADAREALAAIAELGAAFDRLHTTETADEDVLGSSRTGNAPAEERNGTRRTPNDERRGASTGGGMTPSDRRAVQSGLSVGLALLVGGLVSVGAEYWAALPAYQSLTTAEGLSWARNLQRVIAAIAGASGAFALALWTHHNPVVAFALLGFTVFVAAFLRTVASAWTVFWQMVLLATMYDTVSGLSPEAVHVRIVETAAGAVIALLVSALVLPARTRRKTMKRMSDAVAAAMTATHGALERLAHPGRDDSHGRGLGSETDSLFRSIQSLAKPIRDGSGSMARGGIEAQLISLWALLYYVRRLVDADRSSSPSGIASDQWQRLDAATRDNFRAALTVLGGEAPRRIHDVRDIALNGPPRLGSGRSAALADVLRINEALLTYIDDVTPGSTAAHAPKR